MKYDSGEQARRIREVLLKKRVGDDERRPLESAQAVADRIAAELGLESFSGQQVRNYEKDDAQPPIDRMAAWARAHKMRLWLELYDPARDLVPTPLPVEVAALAHAIRDLDEQQLDVLLRVVRLLPRLNASDMKRLKHDLRFAEERATEGVRGKGGEEPVK